MSTESCPPRKHRRVLCFVADIKPIIMSNAVRDKCCFHWGIRLPKAVHRSRSSASTFMPRYQVIDVARVGGGHTHHTGLTPVHLVCLSMSICHLSTSLPRWLDFKHSPKSTKQSCSGKGPCRIRFLFYSFGLQNLLRGTWFTFLKIKTMYFSFLQEGFTHHFAFRAFKVFAKIWTAI